MLTNQFGDLPTQDLFTSLVTWPGLEDALKGIRQEMTEQQAIFNITYSYNIDFFFKMVV